MPGKSWVNLFTDHGESSALGSSVHIQYLFSKKHKKIIYCVDAKSSGKIGGLSAETGFGKYVSVDKRNFELFYNKTLTIDIDKYVVFNVYFPNRPNVISFDP